MTIEALYQIYLKHPLICTDTRKIAPECLFFALKGESFDGNTFAGQALEGGAAHVVIDNADFKIDDRCILVEDVLNTLQNLARFHRKQFSIPFIGITGTNGKTTTKELLKSVLSQKFKTYATAGNLNNHIGVPLTILSIAQDTGMVIIEMGANHQKEIGFLCSIAQPTQGIITNVGKAHLEGFGGFEGVKKGKAELYDYLKETGGTVFINSDNHHLMEMSQARDLSNVVFFGSSDKSIVKGEIIENDPFLCIVWTSEGQSFTVRSNLTGVYNLENILAAIALGLYFGLNAEEINKGIESYVPGNNRSQITQTERNTLICDYYNANPSSMTVALENFSGLQAESKIIILGDMFELGDESALEHAAILAKANSIKAAEQIFIGKEFYKQKDQYDGHFFESTEAALEYLKNRSSFNNSTILIKGSRGMRLEKLVEIL